MGLPQSKIGDVGVGICCCHSDPTCIPMTGNLVTGSPNVFTNGLNTARISDVVLGGCGHTGIMVTGSASVFTNGLSNVRISDNFTGCFTGVIVTGSQNVFTGDAGGATFTEVDFGNVDDEEANDDGLNIYPPTSNPTQEQIERSNELSVAPSATVSEDTTDAPVSAGETPITTCIELPSVPAPYSFELTSNFTLGSVTIEPAISTYPLKAQAGFTYEELVCNLQGWCENIGELLLSKYGNSMYLTSGFRYGSGSSQHERGQAADIQFTGFTNQQYYDAAIWVRDTLQYDQLILEYGGNRPWLHISYNRLGNRLSTHPAKFGTRISAGNYVWKSIIYRN